MVYNNKVLTKVSLAQNSQGNAGWKDGVRKAGNSD